MESENEHSDDAMWGGDDSEDESTAVAASTTVNANGNNNDQNNDEDGNNANAMDIDQEVDRSEGETKRAAKIVDDEEDEEEEDDKQQGRMDDMFGGMDDDDDDDDNDNDNDGKGLTEEEEKLRRQLEYEEADLDYQQVERRVTDIELPNLPLPESSDGKTWHAKLPHFLRIAPLPFNEEKWDEMQESEIFGEGSSYDEDIIRWRWSNNDAGSLKRESNAQIVRWSDGSQSLLIGNEYYDINAAKYENEESASQLTYLVATQGQTKLLETHAPICGTMTFQPSSFHSKAHRRLANDVVGKHVKTVQTKVMEGNRDPEAEAREYEASQKAKTRKPRASAGDGLGRSTRRMGRRSMRSTRIDLMSDEEMEDDEGGAPSLSNQAAANAANDLEGFVVDDDDDGEGEEDEDAEGTEEEDLDALADEAYKRDRNEQRKDRTEETTAAKRRVVIDDDED